MNTDTSATRNTTHVDEPREEKKSYSWWPLLILPVMFAAGYGLRGAQNTSADNARYGVGGGPGSVPCVSPLPDGATLDRDTLNQEGMTTDPGGAGGAIGVDGVGTDSL